eukprot:6952085-Lingulodinium_polyedra.AAC.1
MDVGVGACSKRKVSACVRAVCVLVSPRFRAVCAFSPPGGLLRRVRAYPPLANAERLRARA